MMHYRFAEKKDLQDCVELLTDSFLIIRIFPISLKKMKNEETLCVPFKLLPWEFTMASKE